MKLQKMLVRLQKLHPKEIDLSLNRVQKLCKKLGNPQNLTKCISVVGTNGKNSTIQTIRAILDAAKIKNNIYTSPHIQKINERFIYNHQEISDEDSKDLLLAAKSTLDTLKTKDSHEFKFGFANSEDMDLNQNYVAYIVQLTVKIDYLQLSH